MLLQCTYLWMEAGLKAKCQACMQQTVSNLGPEKDHFLALTFWLHDLHCRPSKAFVFKSSQDAVVTAEQKSLALAT